MSGFNSHNFADLSAKKEDRRVTLNENWENKTPCSSCELSHFCRYANVLKRIDYPSEVFDISITCKLKDNYKAVQ